MEQLRKCTYPTAVDVEKHGLQHVPYEIIPARQIVPVGSLDGNERRDLALLIARAFVEKEPMTRHIANPNPEFTKVDLLRVFIQQYLFDQASVINYSFALRQNGRLKAGVLNNTFKLEPFVNNAPVSRKLEESHKFLSPIFKFLNRQETEAQALLCRIRGYTKAQNDGKVGHIFMIARHSMGSGNEVLKLIEATISNYQCLGFDFIVTEATSQWTGAVMESLGGVRIHFAPYRVTQYADISPDGYHSDKDSGSMLYYCVYKGIF